MSGRGTLTTLTIEIRRIGELRQNKKRLVVWFSAASRKLDSSSWGFILKWTALPQTPQIDYFNSPASPGGWLRRARRSIKLGGSPGSDFGHGDSPEPWGGSLLLSCVHLFNRGRH